MKIRYTIRQSKEDFSAEISQENGSAVYRGVRCESGFGSGEEENEGAIRNQSTGFS